MATSCSCRTCRFEPDGFVAADHRAAHAEFALLVAERPDERGIRLLTRSRREHASMPPHPANHR